MPASGSAASFEGGIAERQSGGDKSVSIEHSSTWEKCAMEARECVKYA